MLSVATLVFLFTGQWYLVVGRLKMYKLSTALVSFPTGQNKRVGLDVSLPVSTNVGQLR